MPHKVVMKRFAQGFHVDGCAWFAVGCLVGFLVVGIEALGKDCDKDCVCDEGSDNGLEQSDDHTVGGLGNCFGYDKQSHLKQEAEGQSNDGP